MSLVRQIIYVRASPQSASRDSSRAKLVLLFFVVAYAAVATRLVCYGLKSQPGDMPTATASISTARPDILDRNGQVLATDITTESLYAEPRKIIDPDEAFELLSSVLPDLRFEQLYNRMSNGTGFSWLQRRLTPRQKNQVMALGIPGIGFRPEKTRFYPGGPTASHILGLVNIDNEGIAGMEKYIDLTGYTELRRTGLTGAEQLSPVRLSIDLRVQHVVHDVITKALARYRAIAAGAVVLNVRTGEVVAMASVPDFDPNNPFDAHDKDKFNRMSAGIYEMGSTIKSFTTAMVLNAGKASLATTFDATRPITIGKQTIHDFHAKGRILTLTEAFLYSSNISSAKAAVLVGIEGHREFLRKIGLLNRLETELPEVARPTEPRVWKRIHSITISFGHGIATTPLQTAAAAAALVNGGKLIPPTFLPRTPEKANALARPVITTQTSQDIRYLYKLNAERGSGGSANRTEVAGYRVGGKTGTAEKVVNGRYSKSVRFNTFIAAFPIDDPQYVVLTIIDEPKPTEGHVEASAGLNAAPMVAEIITRSAISLGVQPLFAQSQ